MNKINIDIVTVSNNVLVENTVSQTENVSFEVQKNDSINEAENLIWNLKIPRIELDANILEGTSEEILNTAIGHFEETEVFNGNIGLAAHNRGYTVNYFQKLKELEIGDEIYYTYKGETQKYIVKTREIIKETDWSYLEKTEDNRLTLITCVEDMPEYRRCIQAVQE